MYKANFMKNETLLEKYKPVIDLINDHSTEPQLTLKQINHYVDAIQCIEFESGKAPVDIPKETFALFPFIKTSYQFQNPD